MDRFSEEWEIKHRRMIDFVHHNRAGRLWVRLWTWVDLKNHDDSGKRTDEHYPVIGAPFSYRLCDLCDRLTFGLAHD